jgi:hypothetical protein
MARHLAGDQSSPWGFHLEHWWPERYARTLDELGFEVEAAVTERWRHRPYLSNVVVVATLRTRLNQEQLQLAMERILRWSMINETEEATWKVWCRQLASLMKTQ